MNLYDVAVPTYKKMLTNLNGWLDKAAAHAKAKSFDPNTLLQARLAPDQFPLVRQVQSACDQAKFGGARTTGKEPPKNPDTETTMDELRARIATTIAFLDTLTPADFDGAEARTVSLSYLEGKVFAAPDFLLQLSLPNFFFHVTHAYAILRHNGVDLGKRDYLPTFTLRDA